MHGIREKGWSLANAFQEGMAITERMAKFQRWSSEPDDCELSVVHTGTSPTEHVYACGLCARGLVIFGRGRHDREFVSLVLVCEFAS